MSLRKDITLSDFPEYVVQSPILWLLDQYVVLILQSLILSVRLLVLKTTGYQHILASVMEADPSVNHALLSAVDQWWSSSPNCLSLDRLALRNTGKCTIGIAEISSDNVDINSNWCGHQFKCPILKYTNSILGLYGQG